MLYEGCVDVESEFNNKQVEVLMAPGDIVKIDKTTGNVVEDTESIHSWEYQADTSDGTEDSSDDSGY